MHRDPRESVVRSSPVQAQVAVADVNNDGKLELVAGDSRGNLAVSGAQQYLNGSVLAADQSAGIFILWGHSVVLLRAPCSRHTRHAVHAACGSDLESQEPAALLPT